MQQTKNDRLYWSCRRGMLELDLILMPFYQYCYGDLSTEQQQHFVDLLACTDVELYTWLTGQIEPEEAELRQLTLLIRDYAQDPSRPRGL